MKNLFILTSFMVGALVIGATLVLPLVVSAAGPSIWPTGYWGPILTCRGTECNFCEMIKTFQNLTYVFLSIGIFAVAPVLIVYGGIRIMTAGASPEGLSAGKRILTGTVVGIALALGAFLIVQTILKTLADVNPGVKAAVPWPDISCPAGL